MPRDDDRVSRICAALDADGLDALVCTLTSNVLMTSGYWPVIGHSIAIVTREAAVALLVPEDEERLASKDGWADVLHTFRTGSLDDMPNISQIVTRHLARLNQSLRLPRGATLGFEEAAFFDPSSYAASFVYGASLPHILSDAFPG